MATCSEYLKKCDQHFQEEIKRYIDAAIEELKKEETNKWPFEFASADIDVSLRDKPRFKKAIRQYFEQKDDQGKSFTVGFDCNLRANELILYLYHPDDKIENNDDECKECKECR